MLSSRVLIKFVIYGSQSGLMRTNGAFTPKARQIFTTLYSRKFIHGGKRRLVWVLDIIRRCAWLGEFHQLLQDVRRE